MRLEGKSALVTGAGSGIGKCIAETFAREGALVALADINLDAAKAAARAIGNNAIAVRCDVTQKADIAAALDETLAAFGSLDILVNNAGISDGGRKIEDITEETWDAVLDLNLKAIFFMIQAFLPFLRVGASPETPRNVINIASIDGCGKINPFYNYAYGVTKAGVIQLGRHVGDSLAWEGIHINTISPGDFPSDLNTTARDYTDEMKKVNPGKRIGEKDNIAGAAIFLASRAGTFNVGSNIVVDGGESVRGVQRVFYARIWPDFVRLDR